MWSPPQGYVASSVLPQELWYNVRDYGAVGNNATDNVAALAAAVAATPSGGTIYFPTGIYKGSSASPLLNVVTKRIKLLGSGPGTILRQVGAGHCGVIDASAFVAENSTGTTVQDMTFATEAGGGDALRLINLHRSTLNNILLPSAGAKGLDLLGCIVNSFNGVVVGSPTYTAGTRSAPTHGIHFDVANAILSNDNVFTGAVVEQITTAPGIGINLLNGLGNVFLGGTSESNTIGIVTGGAGGNHSFIGFDLESNGTDVSGSLRTHNFIGCPNVPSHLSIGNYEILLNASGYMAFINDTGVEVARIPTNATGFGLDTLALTQRLGGTAVSLTAPIARIANIVTAGVGVGAVYGATLQKTESAADANVLTYTPPATAGSYRIHVVISVSAATAATLGWTATWKDSNGSAQAPTNLDLVKNGVAAPALTFLAAAGDTYLGDVAIDIDNSATNIVVKLTFTGTSFTAKMSALIEQLA